MNIDPNLAVLTRADSKFGIEFLKRLALKGIKPKLICVEYTPFSKRLKKAKFLARKIGWRDALRYNIKFWSPILERKLSLGYLKPLPKFEGLGDKVICCDDINQVSVINALSEANITKIVLAQSGIIRKGILNLNKWIINSHPGKLPDFRGVDVIRWALFERKPIEITLHLVDSGIDTGAILHRIPVKLMPDDTIDSIIDRTISISIDILVDASILGSSHVYTQALTQEKSQGKQYYLMPFQIVELLQEEWPKIIKSYDSGK